jgi:hypothetical protein
VTTQRNTALGCRMAELGLTSTALAARLRRSSPTVRATGRYVRMLLDGTIRWPRQQTRNALEQALSRPIRDLGFTPRVTGSPRGTGRRTS